MYKANSVKGCGKVINIFRLTQWYSPCQ